MAAFSDFCYTLHTGFFHQNSTGGVYILYTIHMQCTGATWEMLMKIMTANFSCLLGLAVVCALLKPSSCFTDITLLLMTSGHYERQWHPKQFSLHKQLQTNERLNWDLTWPALYNSQFTNTYIGNKLHKLSATHNGF